MCGRFAMDESVNDLVTEFVERTGRRPQEWTPSWEANYNIAPTQQIPLLLESRRTAGELRFEQASWSLIPPWSETLRTRFPTFNARSETAAEKPTFRNAVASQRAVIFAAAYYEWKSIDGVKKPFIVRPRDRSIMAFAGLYGWWADPACAPEDPARWHLTATILTAPAAPRIADLHDRNPVLLGEESWEHWISTQVRGDQGLIDATVADGRQIAENLLEYYEVGPVRGNGPELLLPLSA